MENNMTPYEKPQMEVIRIENADVITTSGLMNGGSIPEGNIGSEEWNLLFGNGDEDAQ